MLPSCYHVKITTTTMSFIQIHHKGFHVLFICFFNVYHCLTILMGLNFNVLSFIFFFKINTLSRQNEMQNTFWCCIVQHISFCSLFFRKLQSWCLNWWPLWCFHCLSQWTIRFNSNLIKVSCFDLLPLLKQTFE